MLKCEVQVQGKEKTVPSDRDGVEVPEPPERREKHLQLTAAMLNFTPETPSGTSYSGSPGVGSRKTVSSRPRRSHCAGGWIRDQINVHKHNVSSCWLDDNSDNYDTKSNTEYMISCSALILIDNVLCFYIANIFFNTRLTLSVASMSFDSKMLLLNKGQRHTCFWLHLNASSVMWIFRIFFCIYFFLIILLTIHKYT